MALIPCVEYGRLAGQIVDGLTTFVVPCGTPSIFIRNFFKKDSARVLRVIFLGYNLPIIGAIEVTLPPVDLE